ncbi:MAG: outer membrane protein assembly factor BamC [Deltaproteobacteria bacterium]|nr:outer membrane protein assembly factor BamC [Deltaproteobacteria bacterium]
MQSWKPEASRPALLRSSAKRPFTQFAEVVAGVVAQLVGISLALSLASCAYFLPASWRSFRADPDDAPIAITRALEKRQLSVARWDQNARQIETEWTRVLSGVDESRERYVIRWARDQSQGTLTVYVRHEAQDRDSDGPRATWGLKHHDGRKERSMLESIAKELVAMNLNMPLLPAQSETP